MAAPESKALAEAEHPIAAVAPQQVAAAVVARPEPRHEAASPPSAMPAATASPAPEAVPAPAASPTPDAEALAEVNSRIAAVESERDALAAEVARLERQEKFSSLQQTKPSTPPVAATSVIAPVVEPPAAEPGLDLNAASATLPAGMPARVLIRYAANEGDARRRAESLASALTAQGVELADMRESAAAIRTELSFSYAPDEAIARQVGRLVGVTPVRRLQAKENLMARPGTLELSLSGDSHLAAIKTTSTRETNHE